MHPFRFFKPLVALLFLFDFVSSNGQTCNTCSAPDPINSGLIACYPFNNNADDESGNAHHGTPNNITYGTDRFGNASKCGSFNGTSSESVVTPTSFILNTYSYSTWINVSTFPPNPGLYSILSIGSTPADQFLMLSNDGSGHLGLGYGSYFTDWVTPDRYWVGAFPTANTWHHIVLTRTTSTLKFYVDGVLLDTRSTSSSSAGYGSVPQFTIGARSGAPAHSQYFQGLMDDIRIYDRALTATEVLTLYNMPANSTFAANAGSDKTICIGDSAQLSTTAAGATSYSWTPTTGLSNPSIANPYARPTSTQQYIVTVSNGNCTTTDTVIVNVNTDCCTPCASSIPLNSGLVACYPFNANSNDASGNNYHGTASSVTYTTNRFGHANRAASFNGTTSYVDISHTAFQLSQYTYSIWINTPSVTSAYQSALSIGSQVTDQALLFSSGSGTAAVSYNTDATTVPGMSTSAPSTNTWHHFVIVRSSSTLYLYRNGALVVSASVSGKSPGYGPGPGYAGRIGSRVGTVTQRYSGYIDDVRIYNRALSAAEVLSLYRFPDDAPLSVDAGTNKQICTGDSVQLTATGATTYKWNYNLTLSDTTIANPFAKPASKTKYYVLGTTGSCTATDSVEVDITTLTPDAGTNKVICAGDSVRLTPTGATTYKWKYNLTLSDTTVANPFAKPTSKTKYYVLGTTAGCTATDSVEVDITTLTLSAGTDQTICAGDSVLITATSSSGSASYSWSPTTGLSNASIASPYAKPTSTTQYIVTATLSGGCSSKDTVIVNVNTNCCVDCKDPFPINKNLVACLPLNGNANDETNWGNNGTAYSAATATTNRKNQSSKAYSFDGTTSSYINLNPSASLNTANMNNFSFACWFNPATFSTTLARRIFNIQDPSGRNYDLAYSYSANKLVYINWNGTTGVVNIPTKFTFTTNNWYHIAVTIDSLNNSRIYINGELDTFSTNTIVKPLNPVYSIGRHLTQNWNFVGKIDDIRIYSRALSSTEIKDLMTVGEATVLSPFTVSNDASICSGDSLQLSATGAFRYAWTPASSLSDSTIANPYAKPVAKTKYWVTGTAGTCSAKDSVEIDITSLLAAGSDQTICLGDSVQLTATGGGTYVWTPAATLSNAAIADPYAKPSDTTQYIVTIRNGSCSAVDSVIVNVKKIAVDAGSNQTICFGDSIRLQATSGPTATFNWTPTASLSNAGIGNPYAKPTNTTTYKVKATENGCSATDSVSITVTKITTQTISDTTVCLGDSVQLTATGGTSYVWSPSTGLSNPNIANPYAKPVTDQQYIVTISDGSCHQPDTVMVTMSPAPSVNLGNDTTICLHETFTFSPVVSGGNQYRWQPAAKLSNPTILNPTANATAGAQIYTLTVTNTATGCSSTDQIKVTGQKPTAQFTLENTETPVPPLIIITHNTSFPLPLTYAWEMLDSTPAYYTSAEPIDTMTSVGQHRVRLTVTDANGCTDTMSTLVSVSDEAEIFIPNVFTPDGDGLNDFFKAYFKPGTIITIKGTIWNRWGSKIYEFDSVNDNGWNGKVDGIDACSDVYFYIIETLNMNNKVEKFHGTVTLLR